MYWDTRPILQAATMWLEAPLWAHLVQDQAALALILQMVTHMVIWRQPRCAMSIPTQIVTAITPNRVEEEEEGAAVKDF